MARDRDEWANHLAAESGGWMPGFLADEDSLDRRAKWRLGSWGVGALAAMVIAMLASQASIATRRDYAASADLLARQSQQFQISTREAQNEARRLASAIDTLNGDRDRLFSRVSSVEKNLDSVTGSIARQNAAASAAPTPPAVLPQAALPPTPPIAPVETVAAAEPSPPPKVAAAAPTPSTPPVLSKSMMSTSMLAPPDPSASKLSEPEISSEPATPDITASVAPAEIRQPAAELPAIPVQRTEFGIDLGGANSIEGMRALWRGLTTSHKALASLRPIIVVKERTNGLGMQLRLVAGPLGDAATAARLCAALAESNRSCETSVFDGQSLALKNEPAPVAATAPVVARPAPRKRATPRVPPQPQPQQRTEAETRSEETAKPQSSLTSFLGIR